MSNPPALDLDALVAEIAAMAAEPLVLDDSPLVLDDFDLLADPDKPLIKFTKPKRHRRTKAEMAQAREAAEFDATLAAALPRAREIAASATKGQAWVARKIIRRVGNFTYERRGL